MSGPAPWVERRHGPLSAIGDGLFTVEADLESLPIGRKMSIFVLGDGSLAIHSAIACDAPTMRAIEALGEPRFILVPSFAHTIDAPAYLERYRHAEVLTPAAGRARVERRVRVDGDFSRLPADPRLTHELLDGVPFEAVFIHTGAGGEKTLVFNDALMNLPERLPGFGGFVVRLMGSTGGPKVTRTARFMIVNDRARYAAHLSRLAETPRLARVIVGHGADIVTEPAATLRSVARALGGAAR